MEEFNGKYEIKDPCFAVYYRIKDFIKEEKKHYCANGCYFGLLFMMFNLNGNCFFTALTRILFSYIDKMI